ncbi:uncharacterized protein CDV56_109411 [Aspergillus thermomutatus]|uniref:Uncharacterized protein n=1 Tax=Aspergillus thermomutatus TaxID=41047 RepID=A0A397HWQ7_ASPTH|nr:uncharacterized protein CDV56_109411 [Aspergillus thermomutatus]RHZ65996.1 hypothetical protein CDV56_109411 [Aspergillus thermomutatus]
MAEKSDSPCLRDIVQEEDYNATRYPRDRSNRYLKQSLRMLLILTILFVVMTIGFVHLTIQLGRERDLVLHLEQQIHTYENHGNAISKRAIPWFLGAAFWVTNQVFAFYGLATSCKSFTDSARNAALCIWGAISTAATFIGAAAHGASTVKQIHNRLAQNGISIGNWKRDEIVTEAEARMSELLQLPVSLDGFVPHHHPKLARMKLAEGTMWPVFHFYNHHQTGMHFTLTAYEEDHAVMTLGFGHKSDNSSIAKRESYNDEYFSNGGIDFTDCFNDAQSTYLLNTASDYQQMDRDIECYFPDLQNTWGAEIQIYDSNVRTTIGSGSIAAYRGGDHASSISVMPGYPAGISSSIQCERA